MLERFTEINFRQSTLLIIAQANQIIQEYQDEGFTLTVRQLYYQFVARDILPNKQSNYQRLASIIDDGRKAGLIDWDAIEDRTRYLRSYAKYRDPQHAIEQISYAENLWRDQPCYVECWIEKDALLGVIERICGEYRVPYLACRGYASSSELYLAGKRHRAQARTGKRTIVLHLGDHDPSGLDMTRVNDDSVNTFGRLGGTCEVRRVALNMDQVREHNPPPNPAKESDSRFADYQAQYGDDSWELDALNPATIEQLIRDELEQLVDRDRFDAALEHEASNSARIDKVARNWDAVTNYLDTLED